MAQHKSAKKRAVVSRKKNARNRAYLSSVMTNIRKFRTAVTELSSGKGSAEVAQKLLLTTQSSLGKAVAKGMLHRNTASRYVSRLSQRLNAVTKK